ncbi:MAG: MBL fold metallo-hydrolase [Desulfobacterales bacterium]|nr:MBL fold metallo-hydrolase [Desulfobacterales bacterium]
MSSVQSGIKVTILGSGTCVPSLERSSCSVLMQVGNSKMLFDSGPGTMRRLLETHTTIFDLSHIFYSHFHPDHSGEFVPLIFATKYPDNSRRRTPLTVAGGRGLLNFYEGLKKVYGQWIELPPGQLEIIEFDNKNADAITFESFSVYTAPVKHNEESVAYRITSSDGYSVVYTGDTDFCESIIALAKDCDLLICECALPDELRVPGHLTPSLAGELATKAGVGNLVLTHFYPECEQADIAAECRKSYKGHLVLADDLMELEIKR